MVQWVRSRLRMTEGMVRGARHDLQIVSADQADALLKALETVR